MGQATSLRAVPRLTVRLVHELRCRDILGTCSTVPTAPATDENQGQRSVWIVDDSPLEAEMARRALAADYRVEVLADGSAALEHFAGNPAPDILVLDWVMPGLSGIEVCQFLRARPETEELPILLLTANRQTEQIVEGLQAGANDYLAKPYEGAELRARVGALIRSRALRERAEHAESLLRKVLSQLPDAVVTADATGTVIFVNATAERVFGDHREKLLGRKLRELLPGIDLGTIVRMSGTRSSLADLQIGDEFFSPTVSIPPSDDEGNTTITLRNVTDLRVKERRKVDFYSMVAHDLRSPLSALQMRAQMLLQGMRGEIAPEVRDEIERMGARVRDLAQMVNDFLDIAQMESAQFSIEHERVEMSRVCASVYEEYRAMAGARGLELSLNAAADAPVVGDSRRLTQVVGNLVSNAIKFTGGGGRVALRVASDGGLVEVAVEDSGRGISPEAQRRLFQKYERVEGSSARIEGTGLGLVIVKEIVEAHGGTVGVTSTPGLGSTFWMRLPRAVERP